LAAEGKHTWLSKRYQPPLVIAIVTNNKIIRATRFSSGLFSILAHGEVWESEDRAFEIIDHENITYWVQEILTPQQATEQLQEHGQVLEG
jgi:hypothetical protein